MSESSMPAAGQRPKLILVEDDDAVRRSLQLMLIGCGYEVRSFASGDAALADPASLAAEYLVADFLLTDSDGLSLLHTLRSRAWTGYAILVTAFPSAELIRSAEAAGYAMVMEKPLRQQALLVALDRMRNP